MPASQEWPFSVSITPGLQRDPMYPPSSLLNHLLTKERSGSNYNKKKKRKKILIRNATNVSKGEECQELNNYLFRLFQVGMYFLEAEIISPCTFTQQTSPSLVVTLRCTINNDSPKKKKKSQNKQTKPRIILIYNGILTLILKPRN